MRPCASFINVVPRTGAAFAEGALTLRVRIGNSKRERDKGSSRLLISSYSVIYRAARAAKRPRLYPMIIPHCFHFRRCTARRMWDLLGYYQVVRRKCSSEAEFTIRTRYAPEAPGSISCKTAPWAFSLLLGMTIHTTT